MPTDAELLRCFVETHSDPAFAEIVQRHIDVVYRSALRRVSGRNDLAADITQETFTLLARKAPLLINHQALAGWLFTTTRNLACATLRNETRRQQREQEALTMNTSDKITDEWNQVRQELDVALDALVANDREILLLRFFHNKGYSEIGALAGIGEDAARKRVDRALEKLQLRLRRKGITSTAAALAVFLTGEAAFAAPAGLAGSVLKNIALSSAASVPTLFIAKIMSIKTALGLGIVGAVAVAIVATVTFTSGQKTPPPQSPPAGPVSCPKAESSSNTNKPAARQTATETLKAKMTELGKVDKNGPAAEPIGLVIFDADKTFVDAKYKFGAQLPEGWLILKLDRWGTEETTLYMRDPGHAAARPSVYYQMFSEPMQPVDTATADAWLRDEARKKAKARLKGGFEGYVNGEVASRTINDRPAVTWTAEYTRNGEPWGEYLTRIYSNNCTVLYFLNAPKKDLSEMIPGFESLIQTSVVP